MIKTTHKIIILVYIHNYTNYYLIDIVFQTATTLPSIAQAEPSHAPAPVQQTYQAEAASPLPHPSPSAELKGGGQEGSTSPEHR